LVLDRGRRPRSIDQFRKVETFSGDIWTANFRIFGWSWTVFPKKCGRTFFCRKSSLFIISILFRPVSSQYHSQVACSGAKTFVDPARYRLKSSTFSEAAVEARKRTIEKESNREKEESGKREIEKERNREREQSRKRAIEKENNREKGESGKRAIEKEGNRESEQSRKKAIEKERKRERNQSTKRGNEKARKRRSEKERQGTREEDPKRRTESEKERKRERKGESEEE
jgi:hypothetical protein